MPVLGTPVWCQQAEQSLHDVRLASYVHTPASGEHRWEMVCCKWHAVQDRSLVDPSQHSPGMAGAALECVDVSITG